jgi:predicted nucleic acid-binding protein
VRLLLDTNVVSELRKGPRTDSNVRAWFTDADADALYLSVLVVGEIRQGIERARRRDPTAAANLERWLAKLSELYEDRIIAVDVAVAEQWGRLNVPDPLPTVDGLLAATALVHDMSLVTRNTADIARTGVRVVNPFERRAVSSE